MHAPARRRLALLALGLSTVLPVALVACGEDETVRGFSNEVPPVGTVPTATPARDAAAEAGDGGARDGAAEAGDAALDASADATRDGGDGDGGDGGDAGVRTTVTFADDTPYGFHVDAPTAKPLVSESGTPVILRVSLTERTSDPVQVTVGVGGAAEATATPPTLVFTAANWDVPQTITLKGIDDALDDGDQDVDLVLTTTSINGQYDVKRASFVFRTQDVFPRAGLVAHYRGAGLDLSGGGHDLAPGGDAAAPLTCPARAGASSAIRISDENPTSWLARAAHPTLPTGGAARTVSAWVKATGTVPIVSWGAFADRAHSGLYLVDGRPAFVAKTGGAATLVPGANDALAPEAVTDGWHHVLATYQGTEVRLHVDGAVRRSVTVTLATAGSDLKIGGWAHDAAPRASCLDDVRVFDRALAADEIARLALETH